MANILRSCGIILSMSIAGACAVTEEQGKAERPICLPDDPDCCNCQLPTQPCCCNSPIVLDMAGDGVHLTSWQDGVVFAVNPSKLRLTAWTQPDGDDGWLVLDKNGDGYIADGTELFGDRAAQEPPPSGASPNGFLALALYDENDDEVVDSSDSAFKLLRIWQDKDHDGISQPDELHTLANMGIVGLSLAYSKTPQPDELGNMFLYSAPVYATPGATVGMTAWDVLLTSPTRAEREEYDVPEIPPPNQDDIEKPVLRQRDKTIRVVEGEMDVRENTTTTGRRLPCLFDAVGDYVHISNTPPRAASGHAWWMNGNCSATLAVVKVWLEVLQGSTWVPVGLPDVRTLGSGGGSGNRATARVNCATNDTFKWRSKIDVDVIGVADDPTVNTTPERSLACSPFAPPPDPMCD